MRIAVCDDERKMRDEIKNALAEILPNASVSTFDDGNCLLAEHGETAFDIIILDILMPKISGLDTAALLRENDKKTPVIFVSSSEEFGVASYRVFAFDYLLKPLKKEELSNCILRIIKRNEKKESIKINYSGIETSILLSNIEYLESDLRKVRFTLTGGRKIEVVGKLTDFEGYLLAHGFLRCHKSFILNIEHIDSIDSDTFYLTGKRAVKISRTYLQGAKKAYFDYVFGSEV